MIFNTGKELKLAYDYFSWNPEDDMSFGIELYSVLQCPNHLVEAAKLLFFYEHLLMKLESNVNTVVAATLHNLQPMANDTIVDFTAMNN